MGITYVLIFLGKYFRIPISENWLIFLAAFIGFVISVLNSYYWNNKYVFKKTHEGHLLPLLKSYFSYGLTWLISYVLTYLFTNLLHISPLFIPVLSLLITVPLNFIMHKFFAFK
ncbi:MAG: GtrA family protein [Fusobacteria bacterium]|nr:GtrA family protein [Fusobacteriota bacterium]